MKIHSIKTWGLAAILAAAFSSQQAQAQEYHDNVVIVLDASGSMREKMSGTSLSKMEVAKTALKEVLRQVPDSTRIGLLQFGAKDLRERWLFPLGPKNESELLGSIDRPQPGGGTPLGAYIKIGADRLLEERTKQFGYGSYRLLIVTDGEASDRHLVSKYTPDVISRGIVMDVIGVDMRQDHTLAKRAHSYRRANDPEALKSAVEAVFAEVSQSSTDSVGDDAFDLIAGLPTEVAAVALQTLSVSDNHPIGSRPLPEVAPMAEEQPARVTQRPRPPQPHEQPARKRGMPVFVIVIAAFVGLIILKNLFRGGR